MLKEDDLSRLFTLRSTFVLYDFVVFSQLDFISLDHLCDLWLAGFSESTQHLNQTDGHGKHTFGCCHDLFKFFCIVFQIFV